MKLAARTLMTTALLLLAACGGSNPENSAAAGSAGAGAGSGAGAGAGAGGGAGGGASDGQAPIPEERCATAAPQSAEFAQCEMQNFAITTQAPSEQASDPAFLARLNQQSAANFASFTTERGSDPLWQTTGNLCETWMQQCAGDPYLYPGFDSFYTDEAQVVPVNFYDQDGARISGRVWAPIGASAGANLPAVVIENGSVQAPEPLYWWFAQTLVRAGYVVMTYDPRGQGRSDNATPAGDQGSNANPVVFVTNLVDAIDFFLSTPAAVYAHNSPTSPGPVGDGNLAVTTPNNPFHDLIDPERLGIAGHSLGATGVSVVQGLSPWPGGCCAENPVKVAVAWDNLTAATRDFGNGISFDATPRVPAMGIANDYGLTPTPFDDYPDPEGKLSAFRAWQTANISSYQLVIRGGTHYEYSLIPTFPASSWEAGGPGGWGRPFANYYSLAWFDRWLKQSGEPGFDTADARLLDDDLLRERMSYYFRSARDYQTQSGSQAVCESIKTGCP